jgi:hypothetical protein
MRSEQIDEALRRQPTWNPPPTFARRVARMAHPLHEDSPPRLRDLLALGAAAFHDAWLNSGASLAGLRWTLRQYWLLVSQ